MLDKLNSYVTHEFIKITRKRQTKVPLVLEHISPWSHSQEQIIQNFIDL